jgi:hypothetical protein
MCLAMTFILVRKEHDPELAHKRIETGIREREGGGIGGLKFDLFIWAEFPACYVKHWRIEIGSGQMCLSRQQIAQSTSNDARARCDF